MSNDAFYHKDSKISLAMRYSLAIMQQHFEGGITADSVPCAARKMTDQLTNPGRLGRSHERRCKKMRSAIEVAISRGFLRFSGTDGRLTLTHKGRHALKMHRTTLKRRRTKHRGKTPQLATT